MSQLWCVRASVCLRCLAVWENFALLLNDDILASFSDIQLFYEQVHD